MASRRKPTVKQRKLLEQLKIANIPSSVEACNTLLQFILYGHGSIYRKVRQRLDYYKKWSGSRVVVKARSNRFYRQTGRVIRPQMRSQEDIAALTEEHLGQAPDPFVVIVALDSHHRPVRFPTSALRIKNRRDQQFLFSMAETEDGKPATIAVDEQLNFISSK